MAHIQFESHVENDNEHFHKCQISRTKNCPIKQALSILDSNGKETIKNKINSDDQLAVPEMR